MNVRCAVSGTALALIGSVSLGGTETDVPLDVAGKNSGKRMGMLSIHFHCTLFRMAATMLTQTLWQIAAGCTSKRATIMKQSKQGRSG